MSSAKDSIQKIFSFSQVWPRILSTTKIKKYKELAEIVGVTPGRITTRAKENNFPVEWAYWVAKEYDLSVDWLLTGEGEKTAEKKDFLAEIQKWLDDYSSNNKDFPIWFKVQFEAKFPEFTDWRKRKEERQGQYNNAPLSKIANDNKI